MKKILFNSTMVACLGVGAISLWFVADPVTAYAGSSWATCLDGTTAECSAPNSTCIGIDSTESMSGYCRCTSNTTGAQTALVYCDDEPPIID